VTPAVRHAGSPGADPGRPQRAAEPWRERRAVLAAAGPTHRRSGDRTWRPRAPAPGPGTRTAPPASAGSPRASGSVTIGPGSPHPRPGCAASGRSVDI